jgi:hypothetical protein
MATKPLLIFPTPTTQERRKQQGGSAKLPILPSYKRQRERLKQLFEKLQKDFETKAAQLQTIPTGAGPEEVLVLETVGSVADFAEAVRKIQELQWLVEWDVLDISPDDDFQPLDEGKPLAGKLYLAMATRTSLEHVLQLYHLYRSGSHAAFPRGFAPWRHLFDQLHNIRWWNSEDRMAETGIIEYWRQLLDIGVEKACFEIELWYSRKALRSTVRREIENMLANEGGRLIEGWSQIIRWPA